MVSADSRRPSIAPMSAASSWSTSPKTPRSSVFRRLFMVWITSRSSPLRRSSACPCSAEIFGTKSATDCSTSSRLPPARDSCDGSVTGVTTFTERSLAARSCWLTRRLLRARPATARPTTQTPAAALAPAALAVSAAAPGSSAAGTVRAGARATGLWAAAAVLPGARDAGVATRTKAAIPAKLQRSNVARGEGMSSLPSPPFLPPDKWEG
mmetsp:Transcript_65067/g.203924  ORF Transcript_65067/g.203924 Transcript_65067/m.203924 type:complete len:210 (+) Transcript_65067:1582-2211(+)